MAFTPRSSVFESPRLGVEAIGAAGTPVLCTKTLGASKWELTPTVKTSAFMPSGAKVNTASTLISEWMALKGELALDYRELIYYLSSVLNDPVITTPSGATTVRQWQWIMNTTTPDSQRTYTMESGSDSVRASYLTNVQLTDLNIAFTKEADPKASTGGFCQAFVDDQLRWLKLTGATAGTFTITIALNGAGSATSGNIAYNATAATIDTAIEAMTNIGAGNARATGGPANTTAVRIELTGARANDTITTFTVNGGSLTGTTPTATLTRLSPGTTSLTIDKVSPATVDTFFATSFAGLDTAMALANNAGANTDIFNYEWGVTGRNSPYSPLNTNSGVGFGGTVEAVPKTVVKAAVASGDTMHGYIKNMRAMDTLFCRARARGAFIETATAVDYYYELRIDTCFRLLNYGPLKSVAGPILGHEVTGEWFKDATTGRATVVTLFTDQTAL
jgi:hypothetical protein